MKNNKHNLLLHLFVAPILLFSCSIDSIKPDSIPLLTPSVEPLIYKGKLKFNSVEELNMFIEEGKRFGYESFISHIRLLEEKNEFKSLMPTFREDETVLLEQYIAFKIEDYFKLRNIRSTLMSANLQNDLEPEIDLTEDELIADPFFASILNSGRQVIVEDDIYAYGQYGILHTDIGNEVELSLMLEDDALCADIIGSEGTVDLGNGVFIEIVEPTFDCQYPVDKGINGGPVSSGGTISVSQSNSGYSPNEDIVENLVVCNDDFSIWDVFGPTKSCNDYYNSGSKRVKTKAWNQNYLVYASVGLKVKSQKKAFGIWLANKMDELELGYQAAYFEYSLPSYQLRSFNFSRQFLYEFDGFVVDPFGNMLPYPTKVDFSKMFLKFPLADPEKNLIKIHFSQSIETLLNDLGPGVLDNHGRITISNKEVNKRLATFAKNAFKQLTKALNKEINGPVVMIFPDQDLNKVKFVYGNWFENRTDENKFSEVLSWHFEIKLSLSADNWSVNSIVPATKGYDNFKIVSYGLGRSGSAWYGKKIQITN